MIKKFMKDVVPTLTDLRGGEKVFWRAFTDNSLVHCSIQNVLELGVYRLYDSIPKDFPGQSTKILIALCSFYNADKFVSLDIDSECQKTIDHCQDWCKKRGFSFDNHKFVAENSIHFDVAAEFPDGVDLMFLDTNHDDNYPEKKLGLAGSGGTGMTYRELCYYAPHLSEHGRMFVHDTKNYYVPKGYGVNTEGAIRRFLDDNDGFVFREHAPNDNGLGELYRKGSPLDKLYGDK